MVGRSSVRVNAFDVGCFDVEDFSDGGGAGRMRGRELELHCLFPVKWLYSAGCVGSLWLYLSTSIWSSMYLVFNQYLYLVFLIVLQLASRSSLCTRHSREIATNGASLAMKLFASGRATAS